MSPHLLLRRDAHLFANRPGLMERMAAQCETIALAGDQLLHPTKSCDLIVRQGKLRVTQFLADGREVTRAVLQAGAVLLVRNVPATAEITEADPAADRYLVEDLVLMAMGEVELWSLPPGALEQPE